MKRKLSISTLLALVLVLVLSMTAMAAGPGPNADNANQGSGYGNGMNGSYVDADGDNVCDNYASRLQPQDGTGSRWGAMQGRQAGQHFNGRQMPMGGNGNFIDEDGDGVCDLGPEGCPNFQDGTQQMRRGGQRNR